MGQAKPLFTGKGDGSLILITAPSDITVYDVVPFGGRAGIAQATVATGELVNIQVSRIYGIEATTAETFVLGDAVYWDATGGLATVTVGSNQYLGEAVSEKAPAVAGDVSVLLGVKNG